MGAPQRRLLAHRLPELTFVQLASRLVLVIAAGVALLAHAQSDTFWALRAGHDIWHSGSVSLTDRFSSTAAGRYWPDHEWLWQAVTYPLYRLGGMTLLAVLTAFACFGSLVVSLRLAPTTSRLRPVLLGLAVAALSTGWTIRPQAFTLLFFSLLLVLLCAERYVLVPPLMLLWANVHGGVVAGGIALVAVSALAGVRHLHEREADSWVRLRRLLVTTVVSGLATLATPLGSRLWAYVLAAMDNPRYQMVVEWQSAFHAGRLQAVTWVWVAVLVIAVLGVRRVPVSWPAQVCCVLAVVTAAMAVESVRNLGLLVLAALPAVCWLLGERTTGDHPDASTVRGAWVPLIATGLVMAAFVGYVWLASPAILGWTPVPKAAANAVRRCPGRIYNTYGEGGDLIWAVSEKPVFIDSRLDPYATSFVERDVNAERSGHVLGLLSAYHISCAVVPPTGVLAGTLAASHWHLVFADSTWAVFTRPHAPA